MAHAPLDESILIPVGEAAAIAADIHVPSSAGGLVIFAHGSGSSRFSSRNRAVADYFHQCELGTVLLDLLTKEEEQVDDETREFRFDIERLADRVVRACDWTRRQEPLRRFRLGLFGASTGAAAALKAAAERPALVAAVVSRGGRPDLANEALPNVRAPTLLIVGGRDEPVIEMNLEARARMVAPVQLEIVPGATHLFEEPGTLDTVQRLAVDWFSRHLQPAP